MTLFVQVSRLRSAFTITVFPPKEYFNKICLKLLQAVFSLTFLNKTVKSTHMLIKVEKFNNDTASLKIKNSIGSITQKMSNA